MEIEVLGAFGGERLGCRLTSLLIDDRLALDAGALAESLSVERQVGVRSVLLTHAHLDHVASLPFFVENVYDQAQRPVAVYASAETIETLRRHLFNDEVWPDFTRLPDQREPAMQFHELEAGVAVTVEGVRVTPIPVSHTVPTFGFLLEREGAAVVWSSDTGPTDRLWEVANATPKLDAVFLEISFENSMQEVADLSGHLTPATMAGELGKLERSSENSVPVYLHHMKPPCLDAIRYEVRRLGRPEIRFVEQGRRYTFS